MTASQTPQLVGYYINLDRSEVRRSQMEAQLEALGLGWVKRFAAVDGHEVARQQSASVARSELWKSPGSLGCFMSHLAVLQQAPSDAFVLVLEDDIEISKHLSEVLHPGQLPALEKYDLVFLEAQTLVDPALRVGMLATLARQRVRPDAEDDWCNEIKGVDILDAALHYTSGMTAYLVTPSGRIKLIKLLEQELLNPRWDIDAFIQGKLQSHVLYAAMLAPFLATPRLGRDVGSALKVGAGDALRCQLALICRKYFYAGDISHLPHELASLLGLTHVPASREAFLSVLWGVIDQDFNRINRLDDGQDKKSETNLVLVSVWVNEGTASATNHSSFAESVGAAHVQVQKAGAELHPGYALLHRLLCLKLELDRRAEGTLVMLATDDVLFLQQGDVRVMMDGRDHLVVNSAENGLVVPEYSVWRVNARTRQLVNEMVIEAQIPSDDGFLSAQSIMKKLVCHEWSQTFGGVYPLVLCRPDVDTLWDRHPVHALTFGNEPRSKKEAPDLLPRSRVGRFGESIAAYINGQIAAGQPFLEGYRPPPVMSQCYRVINPEGAIALLVLYTREIASYGYLAEHELEDYCKRHGYALHVYRGVPEDLRQANISANWLKPALMQRHLDRHEWLFWVDADILVNNKSVCLEEFTQGHDRVLAMDVIWSFNSGVVGLRNISANHQYLAQVIASISQVRDKSSVYVNQGDQYYFIQVFEQLGLQDKTNLVNCLEMNTPWWFRQNDSFMVHYFGMATTLRALMMHVDAGKSEGEFLPNQVES